MTVPVQARLDRTEGGRGIGYGRRREERESFFEFGLFGPLRVRARVKRRRRGREGKKGEKADFHRVCSPVSLFPRTVH